jgi:hypothetical protein
VHFGLGRRRVIFTLKSLSNVMVSMLATLDLGSHILSWGFVSYFLEGYYTGPLVW